MTEPTIITIDLRLPSKVLHPNARAHWAPKAAAKKADRYLAGVLALKATGGCKPRWTRATTQAVFAVKSPLNDEDNLAAWLKAYWDGIADAGVVVNDRAFKHLPVQVIVSKKTGVSITITRGS